MRELNLSKQEQLDLAYAVSNGAIRILIAQHGSNPNNWTAADMDGALNASAYVHDRMLTKIEKYKGEPIG